MAAAIDEAAPPRLLIAELTHRCPLACPYCSNPLALERREDELDLATWTRVFREAAALGVPQVHLSGGEPAARRDLPEICAAARDAGLYTSLITSGVGVTTQTIRDLWEAGLQHVQISFQDSDAVSSDYIAGTKGAFARKRALAAEVRRIGLPLTLNFVVHRANIDRVAGMVALTLDCGAVRIELTQAQYSGWALENRAALRPTREQVERAIGAVEELRRRHHGRIVIDANLESSRWTRGDDHSLKVTPSGRVLRSGAAGPIADKQSWSVLDHSLAEIWAKARFANPVASVLSASLAELATGKQPPYRYRR